MSPLPAGASEVEFAGGMAQRPIELVKAETIDLPVPARAESVIECIVPPKERIDEGPFGEMIGYMHGPRRPMPVYRVTGITLRSGSIHPFTCEGTGVGESLNVGNSVTPFSMGTAAMLGIRRAGLPIKAAVAPEIAEFGIQFIQTSERYIIKDLCQLIMAIPVMLIYSDWIAAVDEDIEDLSDTETMWEEFATKADPCRDFYNVGKEWAPKSALNIYMSLEEKGALERPMTRAKTTKIVVDATTKEWDELTYGPKRLTSDTLFPTMKAKVEKNKQKYKLPPWKDYREGLRREFTEYLGE